MVSPRSSLMGTRTLLTGYKVFQGINPLYKGSKELQVGLVGINDNLWGHCKSMLASITISSTISPFVINDNSSCSPCKHASLLSSSLPLWHQRQRVSTYMDLKSLLTTPPVNMHDPRTCLYAWSSHPFSFEFILQPYELKVC